MIWFPFALSNADQEQHSSSNTLNLFSRFLGFLLPGQTALKLQWNSVLLLLTALSCSSCLTVHQAICSIAILALAFREILCRGIIFIFKKGRKNPFHLLRCTKVMNADSSRASLYTGPVPQVMSTSSLSGTKGSCLLRYEEILFPVKQNSCILNPMGMTPAPVSSSSVSGDVCVGARQKMHQE